MTRTYPLEIQVDARSTPDAVAKARKGAEAVGWTYVGVIRVDFIATGTWRVTLKVSREDPD
jgi:hypothetical protein